ncbi:MAG: c-type cytochrome [Candidatus Nitrospinota bacterium M3_3B_026]
MRFPVCYRLFFRRSLAAPVLSALAFAVLYMTAPSQAQAGPDPRIGHHLYRSYCYVCHGPEGRNSGPLARKMGLGPADLTSKRYQRMSVGKLAGLIAGYSRDKDSKMPKWGEALPEANIEHLAAYILQIDREDILTRGDVRRGRDTFNKSCVACHGTRGEGDGVLAVLIGIPMVDFTDGEKMKAVSGKALVRSISQGKGEYMPSWAGILSDMEIVDVAAYVKSLGGQPLKKTTR